MLKGNSLSQNPVSPHRDDGVSEDNRLKLMSKIRPFKAAFQTKQYSWKFTSSIITASYIIFHRFRFKNLEANAHKWGNSWSVATAIICRARLSNCEIQYPPFLTSIRFKPPRLSILCAGPCTSVDLGKNQRLLYQAIRRPWRLGRNENISPKSYLKISIMTCLFVAVLRRV